MENNNLVNSFYRDYKKIHQQIQEEIKTNSYIVSRILDRIIIFVFIEQNLLDKDNVFNLQVDIFKNIIQFYKQDNFNEIKDSVEIKIIKSLFKVDNFEENIILSDNLMKEILKKLNKYKWSLKKSLKENYITPDVLGNVFEKFINQREVGAYYTENDTILYINKNSIIYSLFNKLKYKKEILHYINNKYKENDKSINEFHDLIAENYDLERELIDFIENNNSYDIMKDLEMNLNNLRIIDITSGTGAFLLLAISILQKLYRVLYSKLLINNQQNIPSDIDILINIIENNIYGVDIMEDAIEIAKFRLYIKVLSECLNSNCTLKKKIKFNIKVGNVLIEKYNTEDNFKKPRLDTLEYKLESYENGFDWNKEFQYVFKEGGFDCVIGNPPYVEYSKIKNKYKVEGYETLKAKNIYAYVLEKSIKILKEKGVLGVIVPISIISTPRMESLRSFIKNNCELAFYANFGDRPGTLFNGVHQKVTILIAKKGETDDFKIYTTQYYHWYKEERVNLFNRIKYIRNEFKNKNFYYKIQNKVQQSILIKVHSINKSIKDMTIEKGTYTSHLNTRLTFWVKCFYNDKKSGEFKKMYFDSYEKALVFVAILNSSLYYFIWEVISDEWHITNKELEMFKFDYYKLTEEQRKKLVNLAIELENDLEKNKVYIGSKQVDYEYRHKKSKIIIDKIDKILKEYYGFSDEEFTYIIDYNLLYRMNDEIDTYIEQRNAEDR